METTSNDKEFVDMATSKITIVMDHDGLTDGGRFSSSHGSVANSSRTDGSRMCFGKATGGS